MADYVITLLQFDNLGALRHAVLGLLDGIGMQADSGSTLIDNHQVVLVTHDENGHEVSRLLCDIQCLHALGMPTGLAVFLHVGTFAESLFRKHHDALVCRIVHHAHANDAVARILIEDDALHASAVSSHRTDGTLVESHGTSAGIGHDDFVTAIGQGHGHYAVILADVNGNDTIGTRAAVLRKACLLDDTLACAEHDIV